MSTPPMELRRPKQAPPTERGDYYGRVRGEDGLPRPLHIRRTQFGLYVMFGAGMGDVEDYDWYGPVPTCVEASLPK